MQRGVLVVMLLVAGAASAGNVQGQLPGDTTWTMAGSPYTLTGDVTVPAWATLTIEPGVQVIASSMDALVSGADTTKVELIVQGNLQVLGTDTSPVTFKAATAGTSRWRGVRVEAGTTTNISGALIRDAFYGLEVTGTGTIATLSFSTLTGNSTGAYVRSSGKLAMDHTVVNGNSTGVEVYTSAIADLQYDTLASNSTGVAVTGSSHNLTLKNSIVVNNSYGISRSYSYSGTMTLSHNDVWNNTNGNYYLNVTEGTNSLSTNPLFVSATNFRLTSRSPVRKAASDNTSDLGALPYTGDASTTLAGTLHENTTLSGPQTLAGDLIIPAGVTVTIAPGTTFTVATSDSMMAGADATRVELISRGTLQVLGTGTSPVTFKASIAGTSRWRGVRVEGGSITTNISGALIRDAQHGLEVVGTGTVATLSSSTLTGNSIGAYVSASGKLVMDHTVVNANSYGVEIGTSAIADLQYDTIASNSTGVAVTGSSHNLTLKNSIVVNNSYGISRSYSYSGAMALSHNDVWNNTNGNYYNNVTEGTNSLSTNPLFVSATNFRLTSRSPVRKAASDNTSDLGALPYTGDVSTVLAGTVFENTTLSGPQTLAGDLIVPAGVTVTVAPGTTFTVATSDSMMAGVDPSKVELIVQGNLQVQGTDSSPVTFKAATTGSSQWRGIRVEGGTTSTALSGTLIRDAYYGLEVTGTGTVATLSSSTLTGNTTGAYVSSSGKLVMDHTVVHANSTGVEVYTNGIADLQYDTIASNSTGVAGTGSSHDLTLKNSIVVNNSYGISRSYSYSGTMTLSHNDVWNNTNGNYYLNVTEGTNSLSTNPLFVSATNFRLTSRSPVRKAASDNTSDLGALPYTGDVSTVLAGTVFENTTLSGPQTLTGDLIVPAGVTVTVAPGTTFTVATSDLMRAGVDPSKVELISRGTLQVLGTDSSPVTFKATTAGSSQWRGIRVEGGTTSTALSGALIRDATYGLEVAGTGTVATLTSSTLTGNTTGAYVSSSGKLVMDHTVVHANSYGVEVYTNGIADLQYDTIASNSTGVAVTGSSHNLTLKNSIVVNNSYGISRSYSYSGAMALSHNDVWNNTNGNYYNNVTEGTNSLSTNPLFVSSSNFRLTSRSPVRKAASDNTSDLGALPYTGDASTTLAGALHENTTLSGPQTLTGDLIVPAGVTVTVAPGTTFTVATSDSMRAGVDSSKVELIVRGTLQVQGTSSSPVTFKAAAAGSGQWRGIRVEGGTTSTALSGALIRDAYYGLEVFGTGTVATLTSSTLTGNTTGAYVSSSGKLAMDHTVVHANSTGVEVYTNGIADLQYDTLASNSTGVAVTGSSHDLTLKNSIVVNNSYGISRSYSYSGAMALSHNDVWNNTNGNYYLNVTEGTNSFSSNPLFISTTDFHLQAASPCRGVGVNGTDIGALPYDANLVARVEISPTSATVDAAGTTAFSARAYNPEGNLVSDVAFTWSARPAAGTIDTNGVLTASCALGTTTAAVTATSPNGVSASANVTIVTGQPAQLAVSPVATGIEAGASRLFMATVRDSCGNTRTGDTITWSTAPGTGTISELGQYTATCKPGEYPGAVIARLGALSASANVFVSTGPLAQLSISPESPSVSAGGQQLFTALATDSCGNTLAPSLSWSVVNGGGGINPNGLFTAGTAPGFFADTLQVTSGAKVARTSVTVTGGTIASLEITPSPASMGPKGEVTFKATARDAYGNIIPATPTWSVINGGGDIDPTSGTFAAGTVAGTYESTVRAVAGSASATATVTVTPGPADRIEVSPSPAMLSPRGSVRFTARVLDVYGNVRKDTVTWSLVSSTAGTLGTDGSFTATTLAGTYSEVVRAEAGGKSAYATVIVQPGALARLILEPTSASLQVGASQAFSVRGEDESGNEVAVSPSWQVVNGGGDISLGGTFKAGTVAGTYKDTVRVSAEGLSASASIEVTPGPVARVLLSPTNPSVPTRTSLQFTARAEDAFGNDRATSKRTWSSQVSAGTITATGLFTAGGTPGFYEGAIQVEVEGVKATTNVELSRRVARVDVTQAGTSVSAGGTALFTARAFDADGKEVNEVGFTWSALPAAGSVDSSGRLSVSCAPGTVASGVTATAEGVSGSTDVTIVPGPASNLAVSPLGISVEAKGTTRFTASATDKCGNTLPPPAVLWSTASGAGSIDAAGQYTAPCTVGTLSGAVVATLEGLSASASVTVKAGALDSLTLEPESATLVVTEQKEFAVRAADVCGNTLSPTLSWQVASGGGSVNDTGLFTAGTVAGIYPHTLRVSAGNLTVAASLTVLPGPLASLSINPRRVELLPAGKQTFSARGEDRFGNGVEVTPTWNVMVGGGSISASGEFTAGSTAGTYTDTVRANAGGLSAGATVVVLGGPASRIELKPTSATLAPGQQQRFTAQAYDVFGNPSPDSLTWSVAAPQVGSIDSEGLFTAGTLAGVYREAVRVSTGNHIAVADVTVVPGATARVELSPKDPSVKAGGTVQFTARVFDAHGNERPVQPRWSSSVAAGTIDATGLFTAGSTAGNYPSAVTATSDGVSASTSVTVLSQGNPDGGTDGGTDGGGTDPDPKPNPGGCGCSGTTDASAPFMGLMLLALVVTRRRSFRL